VKITATIHDAEISYSQERELVVVINDGGVTFNVKGAKRYTIDRQELLSLIAVVLAAMRRDE